MTISIVVMLGAVTLNKLRLILVVSWLLVFMAYLAPWSESNRGLHSGLGLLPFTAPYLVGLVLGLLAVFTKTRRFSLVIAPSILMFTGILLVISWWYGLALHYVATGGGIAELEPGIWLATAASLVYLLLSIYVHASKKPKVV